MGKTDKRIERLGETATNYQDCLMKIVEYNNSCNIIVEFQDEYKAKVHAGYREFLSGSIKNPYYSSVIGIGKTGNKYPTRTSHGITKEYKTWRSIIYRSFDQKTKEREPTYQDVTCCDEWLLYENFYEWLHSQENFDKWYNGRLWAIDKDILVKGNKIYSPETCCLVPQSVNSLFSYSKHGKYTNGLPVGVTLHGKMFRARCCNPFTNKIENIKDCHIPELAFQEYKKIKEKYIKQVAQLEYSKGNIVRKCYEAMMKYEVEITD